ncbi:MAG: cell division topological specificity factor MinE [Deltaproteobacteria bacterium]|nr:MAG: cell division topological specificity factor MinE [Deltaproteobacteria bacterium]
MRALLKRLIGHGEPPSKSDAKQRLQLLLIHDQVDLSPAQMEQMRQEILEVVGRYVEINPDEMEFRLDKEGGAIALVSTLPVRRVTARSA